jgi:hypothetical protein
MVPTSARVIWLFTNYLVVVSKAVEKQLPLDVSEAAAPRTRSIVRRRSKKLDRDAWPWSKESDDGKMSCAAVVANLKAQGWDRWNSWVGCIDERACSHLSRQSVNPIEDEDEELDLTHDTLEETVSAAKLAAQGDVSLHCETPNGICLTERYTLFGNWWCSLPIDHSRAMMLNLGDGNGDISSLMTNLSSLRVPMAGFSHMTKHSVFIHETLAPGYAFDKTILLPDTAFIREKGYTDLKKDITNCPSYRMPYKRKKPVILFRGSGTGYRPQNTSSDELLRNSRLRAAMLTKGLPGWDVALRTKETHTKGGVQNLDSTIRDYLHDNGFIKDSMELCEMQGYQGLMDIDGNSNAWEGFFSKLFMSSVVFKMKSSYRQWYYHALRPGVDYIEVDLGPRERVGLPDGLPEQLAELPEQLASLGGIAEDKKLTPEAEELMSYDGVSRKVVEWWDKFSTL